MKVEINCAGLAVLMFCLFYLLFLHFAWIFFELFSLFVLRGFGFDLLDVSVHVPVSLCKVPLQKVHGQPVLLLRQPSGMPTLLRQTSEVIFAALNRTEKLLELSCKKKQKQKNLFW